MSTIDPRTQQGAWVDCWRCGEHTWVTLYDMEVYEHMNQCGHCDAALFMPPALARLDGDAEGEAS